MIGLTYILELENISVNELSAKIDVDISLIYRWIKGTKSIPEKRICQLHELFPAYGRDFFSKELDEVDKLTLNNIKIDNQIRTLCGDNTLAAVQERKKLQNEILKNEALIDQQRVIEAITVLFSYLNNGDVNSIRDTSLRRIILNHFIELCNLDNTILANFIENEYDISAYDKNSEEIIFNINRFCEELKLSVSTLKNFINPNPPLPF